MTILNRCRNINPQSYETYLLKHTVPLFLDCKKYMSSSITLQSGSSEDEVNIHSLPCCIDHNGTAEVDKYFNDSIKATEHDGKNSY